MEKPKKAKNEKNEETKDGYSNIEPILLQLISINAIYLFIMHMKSVFAILVLNTLVPFLSVAVLPVTAIVTIVTHIKIH